MSVRVRCRCGQELHLRYGEWVYAFLGLVVLCVALNTVALLVIFFRLDRIAERLERGTGVESASSPDSDAAVERSGAGRESAASRATLRTKGDPAKGALEEAGGSTEPPGGTASEEEPPSSRGSSRAVLNPATREPAPSGAPSPDQRSSRADPTPVVVPAGVDPRVGDESLAANGSAPELDGPEGVDVPTDAPRGLFADEAPLVRLLLLEQAPGALEWRLGFLLDEDRHLRRRALERLRSYSARVTANRERFSSSRAREWLRIVRGALERRPDGGSVLGELAALFPYSAASGTPGPLPFSDLLAATSKTGEDFLRDPAAKTVRESARRIDAVGLDCVLLLDVSRSMENVLVPARRQIARLWPVLRWGLSGVRLGVVLYRDEVVDVLDFSMDVDGQLARLAEVEASGGGDVPESLHLAIKQSLRLGVFDWRPDALKHLIVLGDAPPPYGDQEGLASLVRRAREQAGFRVHALGVNAEEGRESIPFFPDLARAGGGRARTIDPGSTGSEVLLCLQPGASMDLLEPLLAAADRLLSS